MKKIYDCKVKNNNEAVNIIKWLRNNGLHNVSYKIRHANYYNLSIEFFDDKLELAYIMKFDWLNQ